MAASDDQTAPRRAALRITGRRRLHGAVEIAGAKNAAMPCLAAALLADGTSRISRVPDIKDVRGFCKILRALGAEASHDPLAGSIEVSVGSADSLHPGPPDSLVAEQRGSVLLIGALLGRLGRVESRRPGGDEIGTRSIDIHLDGFRRLGAKIEETDDGRITATAEGRLRGAPLFLDYPSVSGTQNLILAAVLAEGTTEIANAAAEPEVVCLAAMLRGMGARIAGAGAQTIVIDGVDRLRGGQQRLIPDRIEAGTLAIAAAISGGAATLRDVDISQMTAMCRKLEAAGAAIEHENRTLTVRADRPLRATAVQAVPYPGFPTDLQAPMMALLTQAQGDSVIRERVFENRMHHVEELCKLGARITHRKRQAEPEIEHAGRPHGAQTKREAGPGDAPPVVHGPSPLTGTSVRGDDIRAAAALVVAALAAEGQSLVRGIEHLDRGYERLEQKLSGLGAEIERVSEPDQQLD